MRRSYKCAKRGPRKRAQFPAPTRNSPETAQVHLPRKRSAQCSNRYSHLDCLQQPIPFSYLSLPFPQRELSVASCSEPRRSSAVWNSSSALSEATSAI